MTALALFFTRGVSLQAWAENGSLEREAALYLRLRPDLDRLAFVTYGGTADLAYASELPGIEILCNRHGLPVRVYERLMPLLHVRALRAMSVFKTNQVGAGAAALRAQRLHRKALLARCGFMWSMNAAEETGPSSRLARKARALERRLFRRADRVAVTTDELRTFVRDTYGVPASRIAVTPNFVDTTLFAPRDVVRDARSLLFVGRLESEKNLDVLFDAVAGLDLKLTVVGRGSLEAELRRQAERVALDVTFIASVPNRELPALHAAAAAFVLPSLFEGHPKALLEAMACGTPIVATDVRGIRSLVEHEQTGLLCGTSASELRAAISLVLGDPPLARRLGAAARERSLDFSLERAVEREWALLRDTEAAR